MNPVLSQCVASSGLPSNILQALNVYVPPFNNLSLNERLIYYKLVQGIILTLMQCRLTKDDIFEAFSQSHFEIGEVRKVWDKLEEKNVMSFHRYARYVAGQH
ncbi:hypothetical protein ABK040_006015 [Willaertia magna]